MAHFQQPISTVIWDMKYRYKTKNHVIDQSITETWRRVAKAISQAEKPAERAYWGKAFFEILEDFHFLPGGRILAGAGTAHQVTLFNCFVMDIAEDSLKGIFDALEEGALTLQQGGGVGYDFSVLRPQGDLAKKTGIVSSGPVSFMRIWDTTCGILLSTGARRGAMMGVLRCDHPDIETFIAAKKDSRELRHFNVSVMVTDEFMKAVREDAKWPLVFPTDDPSDKEIVYRLWGKSQRPVPCHVYRTVRARALWESMIQSAYDYAEPGVLFGDTINRLNNLFYRERIQATNPCGEIPLPAYGACNLGAINLTQFVTSPFTQKAAIHWQAMEKTVRVATRFLDNVIDVSHYPLNKQKIEAQGSRRIGLGLTGLADFFVMLGIVYGSAESIKLAKQVMRTIAQATWETSIELAKEKGVFPFYEKAYVDGEFVKTLDSALYQPLCVSGCRNSHHNTIAPTGTISLLANNVSNGIEPIFKKEYDRHVRATDGQLETFRVKDYAFYAWEQLNAGYLPAGWIDIDALSPQAHLAIQAAVQPYVDNAISKTINVPIDFPFDKLADVFTEAYQLGLKGCTVFRPNPTTGCILEVNRAEKKGRPIDHCCPFED